MEDLKKILEKIELSLKAQEEALAEELDRKLRNDSIIQKILEFCDENYFYFQEDINNLSSILEPRFTIKCSKWQYIKPSPATNYHTAFGSINIKPNFLLEKELDGRYRGIEVKNIKITVLFSFNEYKAEGFHLSVIAKLNEGVDKFELTLVDIHSEIISEIMDTWRREINAEALLSRTLNYYYSAAPNA
jgi:hypothetical protein